MIEFKRFNQFIEGCWGAHRVFRAELIGVDLDLESSKEASNYIYGGGYSEFEAEFEQVFFDNLDKEKTIKGYLEKVYYNGVVMILLQFKHLEKERRKLFDENGMEMLSDESYIKINNGYCYSLQWLANKIRSTAHSYKVYELKSVYQIDHYDYNISGEYMKLTPAAVLNEKEPNYLLPLPTLQKIHSAFDGDIWEHVKASTFYSVFDKNNTRVLSFKVKHKTKFYALLWKMYNLSDQEGTKKAYIQPLLIRYGCCFNKFSGIPGELINKEIKTKKEKAMLCEIDKALS